MSRVSDIPAGDGKINNLFYSVHVRVWPAGRDEIGAHQRIFNSCRRRSKKPCVLEVSCCKEFVALSEIIFKCKFGDAGSGEH